MKSLIRPFLTLALPLCAALSLSAHAENPLPDIELQTLEGESMLLSETDGKFRVINFWATWCPPCVKEMPSLAKLDKELESIDGDVITVNVGEQLDQVEAFILENLEPNGMTMLLDPPGKAFPAFKLSGLPITVVVSADSQILDYALGEREWDSPDMVDAIKGLAR